MLNYQQKWTKNDTCNVCLERMRLHPSYHSSNGFYEDFTRVTNGQEFLDGIENKVSLE